MAMTFTTHTFPAQTPKASAVGPRLRWLGLTGAVCGNEDVLDGRRAS
jgi:hypothetical protein